MSQMEKSSDAKRLILKNLFPTKISKKIMKEVATNFLTLFLKTLYTKNASG